MLCSRGHHVEVFTSSDRRSGTEAESADLLVHRIDETDRCRFGEAVALVFIRRHAEVGFDVIESPEYHADAREAIRAVPSIPLVVKLHTPSEVLLKLNYYEASFARRLRMYLGSLAHGSRQHWGYSPEIEGYRAYVAMVAAMEQAIAHEADEIVAPSDALGRLVMHEWKLQPGKLVTVPYPFDPDAALLNIPPETETKRITFLGRLEVRKGVIELAEAIPRVLDRCPDASFAFVGAAEASPTPGVDMRDYLEERLRNYAGAVTFAGPAASSEIFGILANTDICVIPSRWENFPNVCLEAMAAARGIVGSRAGGMTEMLDSGRAGRLVPPGRPLALAGAVADLLENPAERIRLGTVARRRLLEEYNADRVGALQEASYQRAIERRRAAGPRKPNVA